MTPDEIAREIVQKAICTNIHTGKEWLAEGYGYPDLLRAAIASALATERTAREKAEAEREIDYARIAASQVKAAREAALREAAEFIRVQRNETPATGEEFAVALLSLINQEPTS